VGQCVLVVFTIVFIIISLSALFYSAIHTWVCLCMISERQQWVSTVLWCVLCYLTDGFWQVFCLPGHKLWNNVLVHHVWLHKKLQHIIWVLTHHLRIYKGMTFQSFNEMHVFSSHFLLLDAVSVFGGPTSIFASPLLQLPPHLSCLPRYPCRCFRCILDEMIAGMAFRCWCLLLWPNVLPTIIIGT
jgi:hypothetical protein